jgi:hypothetical protein
VAAIDLLPQLLAREDTGTFLRSLGEWLSAYQRVTHYFRALDVWQPPPHLLAWVVLERAVSRTTGDHDTPPLRLAMEEVHALLREQGGVLHDLPGASRPWYGSVWWRICSWLARDGRHITVQHDTGTALRLMRHPERLMAVPAPAPAPMVPQPLDLSPLRRLRNGLAAGTRHVRFGPRWRRRHA